MLPKPLFWLPVVLLEPLETNVVVALLEAPPATAVGVLPTEFDAVKLAISESLFLSFPLLTLPLLPPPAPPPRLRDCLWPKAILVNAAV